MLNNQAFMLCFFLLLAHICFGLYYYAPLTGYYAWNLVSN